MAKLKSLLEDVLKETRRNKRHETIESVRGYGGLGSGLYKNNVLEVASKLSEIADAAHSHIIGENDEWFDKITVNKNMKSLKGSVSEFKKAALESHRLNQRMTALYEDMGGVLNRYYDIDEGLLEGDKGDMDNDGKDEPDDEEYMDNKDKAIKKAMGETYANISKRPTKRLKDINSVVGIGVVGNSFKK